FSALALVPLKDVNADWDIILVLSVLLFFKINIIIKENFKKSYFFLNTTIWGGKTSFFLHDSITANDDKL
ncbi:hypothetical protein BpHYR1_035430, partial [Brachionus plicatilis]